MKGVRNPVEILFSLLCDEIPISLDRGQVFYFPGKLRACPIQDLALLKSWLVGRSNEECSSTRGQRERALGLFVYRISMLHFHSIPETASKRFSYIDEGDIDPA